MYRYSDQDIILLFNNSFGSKTFPCENCIDFRQPDNYYFSILVLLEKITSRKVYKTISQEFRSELALLVKNFDQAIHQKTGNNNKNRYLSKYKVMVIVSLVFVIISILAWVTSKFLLARSLPLDNVVLKSCVTDFSSDNYSSDKVLQKNFSLTKKIESMFYALNRPLLKKQALEGKIEISNLLNLTYCLHSLASQYVYNKVQGEYARDILFFAKSLIEDYINGRNTLSIDFNRLTYKETLAELSMVKDLPQIYTRIIHTLGKTYVYDGDLNDAKKYFVLSNKMGIELSLFEGLLSRRDGLELISRVLIEDAMASHDYDEAKEKILLSIKTLKSLQKDKTNYAINYRPHGILPEFVKPEDDSTHLVSVKERMANYYSKLLKINEDKALKAQYLTKIITLYCDKNQGILRHSQFISPKKRAGMYNALGFILIDLISEDIDSSDLFNALAANLDIQLGNPLRMIEEIFLLSQSIGRYTDDAKADSYHGLFILYGQMSQQIGLSLADKDSFLLKSKTSQKMRDELNKSLKRVGWRVKFYPNFIF